MLTENRLSTMTAEIQTYGGVEQYFNGEVVPTLPKQRKKSWQTVDDSLSPLHYETDCATSTSSDAMLNDNLSFPDKKMLYLPVKLNNKHINAFVDTSCSANYIRLEAVPTGTRYESVDTEVIVSVGHVFPITRACYLDTEIDGKIYKVFYLVFESMTNMLMLGLDWMEEYLVKVDVESGTLAFDNKMLELTKVFAIEFAETYYGQNDFDMWLPKRPPFFWAYLDKISKETLLEPIDVYYQLEDQLIGSTKRIELEEDTHFLYIIYEANRRSRVYVPTRLRVQIFNRFHCTPYETHLSAEDTWQSIRVHYYWPEMREEIYDAIQSCATCREKEIQQADVLTSGVSIKKEIEIASEDKNISLICEDDDEKINLKPQCCEVKLLFLPVKLNNKLMNVLIDSSASRNFIRPEAVPEGTRCIHFESVLCSSVEKNCRSTKGCYLDTEISGKTYKIYFLICQDLNTMVTFGMDWMEKYKVRIDVGMASVTFDNRTLKLAWIDNMFTYYGQTDFDLWRPVFFKKYLKKIRRETELEKDNELATLFSSEEQFHYSEGVYEVIKVKQRPQIYVPLKLRAEIINEFHLKLDGKHNSATQTWEQTRDHYCWPKMRIEIHNAVRDCGVCRDEKIRLAYAEIGEPMPINIRIKLSVKRENFSESQDKHVSRKIRASVPVYADNPKRRRKTSETK